MGECMVQTVTSFLKCLLEGQGIWVIIRLRNLGYYNLDQVGLFIGSGHSWLKVVDLRLEAGGGSSRGMQIRASIIVECFYLLKRIHWFGP